MSDDMDLQQKQKLDTTSFQKMMEENGDPFATAYAFMAQFHAPVQMQQEESQQEEEELQATEHVLRADEEVLEPMSGGAYELQSTNRSNQSKHQRNKLKREMKKEDRHRANDRKFYQENGGTTTVAQVLQSGKSQEVLEATRQESLRIEEFSLEQLTAMDKGVGYMKAEKKRSKGHLYALERHDITGQARRTRAAKYKDKDADFLDKQDEQLEADVNQLIHNVRLDQLNRGQDDTDFQPGETTRMVANAAAGMPILTQELDKLNAQHDKLIRKIEKKIGTDGFSDEVTALQGQAVVLEEQQRNAENFNKLLRNAATVSTVYLENCRVQALAIRRAISILEEDNSFAASTYNDRLIEKLKDRYDQARENIKGYADDVTAPVFKTRSGGEEARDDVGDLIQRLAELEKVRAEAGRTTLRKDQEDLRRVGYGHTADLLNRSDHDDHSGDAAYAEGVRKLFQEIQNTELKDN